MRAEFIKIDRQMCSCIAYT